MAKILYVITRLAVGGAPNVMLTAIKGLKKTGHEIVLVSGYPGEGEGSLVEDARALDIELVLLPNLQREIHPIKDVKVLWQLRKLMTKGRFDLVHTHLSKAGIVGRLAAFLSGIPVVHTFHGDVLEGYFSSAKSRLFLMAERFVGRFTARFVCVSNNLKDRLMAYRLGPPERFCVVKNGIDLSSFERIQVRVRGGKRVGTLAMFYPIKRLDVFVDVAHRLKLCDESIMCDLAGDGMMASALVQQAQKLGHPVNFVGVCEDRAAFLLQLDVFVLCSDYESCGMSVMEAMAMGLPVVATAVGGIPEIVQHGETGMLVEAGDREGMTQAIWDLLQDEDRRQRMGEKAKIYADTHFSHERMIDEIDVLYHELLS